MELGALPCLLVKDRLIKPIQKTTENLASISDKISEVESDKVLLHGLFVLCVSYFENSFVESLKYYLKCFPQKLDKALSLKKEEVITKQFQVVDISIDRILMELSYASLKDIVTGFSDYLSLDLQSKLPSDTLDEAVEFKESRNLLIHNNLVSNQRYLDKAGKFKRATATGSTLTVNGSYINKVLSAFNAILSKTISAIENKYSAYTKGAALESLWYYLFDSRIMKFEDYWDVSGGRVHLKRCKYERDLSNSERMFLGVWRTHFNGNKEWLDNFCMYSLDDERKAQMLYFLSIVDDFRLE